MKTPPGKEKTFHHSDFHSLKVVAFRGFHIRGFSLTCCFGDNSKKKMWVFFHFYKSNSHQDKYRERISSVRTAVHPKQKKQYCLYMHFKAELQDRQTVTIYRRHVYSYLYLEGLFIKIPVENNPRNVSNMCISYDLQLPLMAIMRHFSECCISGKYHIMANNFRIYTY